MRVALVIAAAAAPFVVYGLYAAREALGWRLRP